MPINALIPMAGNRSRLPGIFELGARRRDTNEQRNVVNRQNDERLNLAERKFTAEQDEFIKEEEQVRQAEVKRSNAIYSEAELNPLLESNDIPGAMNSLTAHRERLVSEGADTQGVDASIKLLSEGNVDEVKRLSNINVQDARMRELIPDSKETKAQSAIGKIRADESAGFISSEDAQKAIRKSVNISKDKLNTPGTLVMASDLNPDIPEEFQDVAFIQQPNGTLTMLKGQNGEGGKVTFTQKPDANGNVEVFMQEGSNKPVSVGLLESKSGEAFETAQGAAQEGIQDRTDTREDRLGKQQELSEQRLFLSRESLKQSITQQARTSEGSLRDDFDRRAKPYREQLRQLDMLDLLLSGDVSALDEAQITNQLATLSDSNVRAQANLNTFKNPGDIGTRIAGAISKLFTGTRTPGQLDEIRQLSGELRNQVFNPALNEVSSAYRDVAVRSRLDPNNVVISRNQPITALSDEELEAEKQRLLNER